LDQRLIGLDRIGVRDVLHPDRDCRMEGESSRESGHAGLDGWGQSAADGACGEVNVRAPRTECPLSE
jgi:hypothetical protein